MHPRRAEGFEWDEANEAELAAHSIAAWKVEEVFLGDPAWAPNKRRGSGDWKMVGVTQGNEVPCLAAMWEERERMSERDEAGFYQAHKDDEEVWDDLRREIPEAEPRKTLGATVTVRFSSDDAQAIRKAAKARGLTYSEIVRNAVKAYLHPRFTLDRGVISGLFPSMAPEAAFAQQPLVELLSQEPDESRTGTSGR